MPRNPEADLGAALAQLATIPLENESIANILNVADNEPMTYDAFMAEFGARFGIGTPSKLGGLRAALNTNAIQTELLGQSTVIDSSKAKEILGWKPQVTSKEDGIERSMLVWRAEAASNMTAASLELATS